MNNSETYILEPLSTEAVRVLGALVEKSMSTPEYYPLTINALRNACNQKSNRSPVVTFRETDIVTALDELEHLRLIGHVSGGGSRTLKYRHALAEQWNLSTGQCAVLSCLLVRGAQTTGEIKGRTARLYLFDSLSQVSETIDSLSRRETPLVQQLSRRPGQKEDRYAHLLSGKQLSGEQLSSRQFSGELAPTELGAGTDMPAGSNVSGSSGSMARGGLRDELEKLREEVERLRQEFEDFRSQF